MSFSAESIFDASKFSNFLFGFVALLPVQEFPVELVACERLWWSSIRSSVRSKRPLLMNSSSTESFSSFVPASGRYFRLCQALSSRRVLQTRCTPETIRARFFGFFVLAEFCFVAFFLFGIFRQRATVQALVTVTESNTRTKHKGGRGKAASSASCPSWRGDVRCEM